MKSINMTLQMSLDSELLCTRFVFTRYRNRRGSSPLGSLYFRQVRFSR